MNDDEVANFKLFRDCLATPLIKISAVNEQPKKKARMAKAGRKTVIKTVADANGDSNDVEELAEFIDYIAMQVFMDLPPLIRTLTYTTWFNSPMLQDEYPGTIPTRTATTILTPLDPSISDSLTSYNILPIHTNIAEFLTPVLAAYLSNITTRPPAPSETRNMATACEICGRSWIPLTYHHLIPKGAHEKALKRGWHTEDQLNNVAWICRACHSYVHSIATNEELARDWYTIERLLEREDVIKFAGWVGKLRWKGR